LELVWFTTPIRSTQEQYSYQARQAILGISPAGKQLVYSPAGAFRLTLQATDGNIVLQVLDDLSLSWVGAQNITNAPDPVLDPNATNSVNWVPVWSPHIQGQGATELDMQMDGNLVAYNKSGGVVWNSASNGNERAVLLVQDDGNLVIYAVGMKAVFATNTSARESKGFNTP
jgi:hypothetical protein